MCSSKCVVASSEQQNTALSTVLGYFLVARKKCSKCLKFFRGNPGTDLDPRVEIIFYTQCFLAFLGYFETSEVFFGSKN